MKAIFANALTRGGLDMRVAVNSLPAADRSWLETLLTQEAGEDTASARAGVFTLLFCHSQEPLRPRLLPASLITSEFEPTLSLDLPVGLKAKQEALCRSLANRRRDGIKRARQWVTRLTQDQLNSRLLHLTNVFAHIDPVIFFAEERAFTNLYHPPNLTGGAVRIGSPRCALTQLLGKSPVAWSGELIEIFYTLTQVADVGSHRLFEELNFHQLGFWHLQDHVKSRHEFWSTCGAMATASSRHDAPSAATLDQLATARDEAINSGNGVCYRSIIGPTLTKTEKYVRRPAGGLATHATYALISSTSPLGRARTAVTILRDVLARSAHELKADYAMSRGIRDYNLFTALCEQQDFDTIMRWEPERFFCFVTSGEGDGDAEILRSISARMRYNSWHFLPDSLRELGAIPPPSRDYYFAPAIPDISRNEDRIHAGHIRARIRFAIRFPIPIMVAGRYLRGLADLRVARTQGKEYQERDLIAVLKIAHEVAQIHQAMADLRLAVPDDMSEY